MQRTTALLALAACPADVTAVKVSASMELNLNPIRKVVTMLQMMSKKVEEERETETQLYNKFLCYCKKSSGSLGDSISAAETKIPQLTNDIKASEADKAQVADGLKEAQNDRAAAKAAMKEATEIRDKDAAAYAAEKGEADSNIGSTKAAIQALEKGMAGSFVQTHAASALKNIVQAKQDMVEQDREDILAFLANGDGSDYAPQSGQITGILKQMLEEMQKNLADATEAESSAIKDFEDLMAAKKKEVVALTKSIETKMTRIGELAVSITQMKNDLEDSEEQLGEDRAFMANLGKSCDEKKADWEAREKTRGEEVLALAETIKVLNDDDSLELFKKTLPSGSSFLQMGVRESAMRSEALSKVRRALSVANGPHRAQLDLIVLAFRGKKIGFEKIMSMIDEMAASLKTEQQDDDNKREFCSKTLDEADDQKKALQKSMADGEAAIASTKDNIQSMTDAIASLTAGIQDLDASVARATEQRKEENKEFKETMASDGAAKELLNYATNRLNKFYNPKLYKPAPKTELSAEDRIYANQGGELTTPAPGGIAGTGITALAQRKKGPGAAPETFGAYKKKSEENNGVLSMLNLLIADLDKEMTVAQTSEKDAQADYETLLKDSAEKRAIDAKALTEKGSAKAELEGDLEEHKRSHASDGKQLRATKQYIAQTHSECDWLMQYYDVRKSARASEIDALGNAKAVLSGADYSL